MSEANIDWFSYLNQSQWWYPVGPRVTIESMGARWRSNAARRLERKAKGILLQYEMQAIDFMLTGMGGFANMTPHGEMDRDAYEYELEQRFADPVGWMRATPLHKALVSPAGSVDREPRIDETALLELGMRVAGRWAR